MSNGIVHDNDFPPALSACKKGSFAYETVKDRMPVILTKVIDTCHKQISLLLEQHGGLAGEDAKNVVSQLSQLRSEIMTDKPILPIEDTLSDIKEWEEALVDQSKTNAENPPSWFSSPWLFVECYMYRKIANILNRSSYMKQFDPFQAQKETALEKAIPGITVMLKYLSNFDHSIENSDEGALFKHFETFLKASLWSNQFDLSVSGGVHQEHKSEDPVEKIKQLQSSILVDDINAIFFHLRNSRKNVAKVQIDFILDNAGYELCSDLILAEFLLSSNLADEIRFHVKSMPWFVSDVTFEDFDRTLAYLCACDNEVLSSYGKTWQSRLKDGTFYTVPAKYTKFWTLSRPYCDIQKFDPELHNYLASSQLLIFKGDLNYRKLVGDLQWPHETLFKRALRGFCPASLCSLRTLKADVVVGLQAGQAKSTQEINEKWMVNGKFSVIQSLLHSHFAEEN